MCTYVYICVYLQVIVLSASYKVAVTRILVRFLSFYSNISSAISFSIYLKISSSICHVHSDICGGILFTHCKVYPYTVLFFFSPCCHSLLQLLSLPMVFKGIGCIHLAIHSFSIPFNFSLAQILIEWLRNFSKFFLFEADVKLVVFSYHITHCDWN